LLLLLKNVVHDVQDHCLFNIESLEIFEGDRIGLIGRNGVGKSTLLGILAGTIQPSEGNITRYCPCSYIAQLEDIMIWPDKVIENSLARQFAAKLEYSETMSGGEKTRYRLATAFGQERQLLLADEPTANLDISGAELLQTKLQNYQGAFVLVSHDHWLLDAVCNITWEIDESHFRVYHGNYNDYLTQKENERKQEEREYENYSREKKHLEQAIRDRQSHSALARKAPKRMGNSEARLHKMGDQKAKANLDKAAKAIQSRLTKLEEKAKPKVAPTINFGLSTAEGLYSKIVMRGEKVNKSFGSRILFRDAGFNIMKGQKVALCGGNGCGKTTLLKMIMSGDEQIYVSPGVRIGYFAQDMKDLNPAQSIITNVMAGSVQDEGFVRNLLAWLLFRGDDVYKKVGVLSGGELVRVALAKIMVSQANILLLDEPTNYLDLSSIEALEDVLADYDGTILFASHDRKFINKIATHLMVFVREGIQTFTGNYEQYLQDGQARKDKKSKLTEEERLLLEYRLTDILSRLSVTKDNDVFARLDEEYRALCMKLK